MMAAKSRRKGAQGERLLVNYLCDRGIPSHRVIRTATSREADTGDVHSRIGGALLVWQVKVGKAAQDASETTLGTWWADTMDQAVAAGADLCALAVQRRGVGMSRVAEWQVLARLDDVAYMHDPGIDVDALPWLVVRMPLGSLLAVIDR